MEKKIYTEKDLRGSPNTLKKFLFKRLDSGESMIPDEKMLYDAVLFYRMNTSSNKPFKSRSKLRGLLMKNYLTLLENGIIKINY